MSLEAAKADEHRNRQATTDRTMDFLKCIYPSLKLLLVTLFIHPKPGLLPCKGRKSQGEQPFAPTGNTLFPALSSVTD
jgi:hypothetical protein